MSASIANTTVRSYTVNRRLLLITVVVSVAVGIGGYLWYKHRLQQTAYTLLSRAEQLEREQEWSAATSYYQRYLLVEPDDTDVLIRLTEAFTRSEAKSSRPTQLNNLLYRVVGRAPDRADLRLMLAENLLSLGEYEKAEAEALKLLDSTPEYSRQARKQIALAQIARVRLDSRISVKQAIDKLLEAAEELPGDSELIGVAAKSLREHSTALEQDGTDPVTRADKLMDDLVAKHPQDVVARLTRYRYRTRYRLADANIDLREVLEIDPANVEGLLLSALKTLSTSPSAEELAGAKAQLRQTIELSPTDYRAYLALANLLEQSGKRDEAIELLRKGKELTDNQFDLCLALANLLLRSGNLEECETLLHRLESENTSFLVQLEADARTSMENRLELTEARLDLARNHSQEARSKLKSIFLSEEASPGNKRTNEWIQATNLLAACHAQLGEWDNAEFYWDCLGRILPGDVSITESAVVALLKEGQPSKAIEKIDSFTRTPSEELLVQRVQAHLMLQFARMPEERNWSEFQNALKAAKSTVHNRLELLLAEVDYLMSTGGSQAASARLRKAEDDYSKQLPFWVNAAKRYQWLGESSDFQRAMGKHRQFAKSPADHASLEATILANEGKFTEAEEVLVKVEPSLGSEDLLQIQTKRVKLRTVGGNLSGAYELIEKLIGDNPKDVSLLALGAEVALAQNELKMAKTWEDQLRDATEDDGQIHYLSIRRLLQNYDQLGSQETQQLGQLIVELRAERPRWYPIVALSARFAQLRGDKRQALSDFQLSVDLGDRRPFTLQQLVTLLYEYGRFEEAQESLSLLADDNSTAPIVDAVNMELAVKQNRVEDALKLARQGVAKSPQDVPLRLYLASLLLKSGRTAESLEVLRNAVHEFESDYRIWTGLFTALIQAGQFDEAQRTVDSLASDSLNPLKQRHLVVAQGYELLGHWEGARKQYEMAIAQQPTNSQIRLRYAKLLASRSPRSARKEYERILQYDAFNPEARRELSILLAATGQEADWRLALELLESDDRNTLGNVSRDDLLRAILISKRGRTHSERSANRKVAAQILERLIETSNTETLLQSRLLLAQLLEQEAAANQDQSMLFSARDQFRSAIQEGPPSAERLSLYIEFLLRSSESEIGQLMLSQSEANDETTARLDEIFLQDAESRLKELRQLQGEADQGLKALIVSLTARLMQARGQDANANEYVAQFVADQSSNLQAQGNTQQYLMFGKLYSSLGNHSEAEKWYRRLVESNSGAYVLVVKELLDQGKREEAATFCLEVSNGRLSGEMASLLANVMTVTDGQLYVIPEAEAALVIALQDHANNLDLLQAEAVMRASRGEYDLAIDKFSRILELDPENELALNNLATILSERPNQRVEALELIERAISLSGRQAALLDTKGTICMKLGDTDEAVACLEEATAGGATDARYYLHLAAAYRNANRPESALRMLNEVRSSGLEKYVLTEDDRNLYSELERELDTAQIRSHNQL